MEGILDIDTFKWSKVFLFNENAWEVLHVKTLNIFFITVIKFKIKLMNVKKCNKYIHAQVITSVLKWLAIDR